MDHLSTRRLFLQKGLTLLAAAPTVPAFLDSTVMAMANPLDTARTGRDSGKDGKILVVVQLSGGNDGLNTVIPYADDHYHRSRPQVAVGAREVLRLNDYIGLHPNLAPLKELYDDGRLSIIQGVGYPNPNRSHFRSMDIWHSAQPEREVVTNGWLGRYFDNTCSGADPHVGVTIGETNVLAMKGDRISPLQFERPEAYRYRGDDLESYLRLNAIDPANPTTLPSSPASTRKPGRRETVQPPTADQQLDFLHRTALDAQLSSDRIQQLARSHRPDSGYPGNEFGQGLRTVAAMIRGGLPTRVYYVALGGFDTHAAQKNRHDQLMQQFAQGVRAFWRDLKQQENDQRVLMLTFSEFGRRVKQNASQGTDHGAAAPMFLIGPSVTQGIVGAHPSLTDLDEGDLRFGIDFRSVYATVLQQWLNTPSKPVLGRQFPQIERLIRG
jgi:uncharacterized protein (DUF1501 family)